ncbi:MAG: tRNA (adenosine(37)-N6)-threonylcarbamoyltransferase complex dimerization subunit type 1 TsaB [Myxococcota bacterium]
MSAEPPTRPDAAWLLALDASTPRGVIAVGHVDATNRTQTLVVQDERDDGANQASTRLLPRIEAALRQAGITAGDLAAVACGRGPGTFTGTRVAVASAKGLAYGLGRPVLALSTLAAVAASAEHEGAVLAVLDARRGEVYGSPWRCSGPDDTGIRALEAEGPERVTPLGDLLEALRPWPEDLCVAGSGVEPYRHALPPALAAGARPLPGPSAAGVWAVAANAWVEGRAEHPAALEAVYLRASYAEMGISKPKRPFVKSPFV